AFKINVLSAIIRSVASCCTCSAWMPAKITWLALRLRLRSRGSARSVGALLRDVAWTGPDRLATEAPWLALKIRGARVRQPKRRSTISTTTQRQPVATADDGRSTCRARCGSSRVADVGAVLG